VNQVEQSKKAFVRSPTACPSSTILPVARSRP
jgi:hypothetical protein